MNAADEPKNEALPELCRRLERLEQQLEEREHEAETLAKREAKYRVVVEKANEAIVVIQDGRFRFFNQKALDLIASAKKSYFAEPFERPGRTDPAGGDSTPDRPEARNGAADIYEYRIVDRSGRVRWLEIKDVPIEWEGRPATLSFWEDRTDLKKAEKARKESESKYRLLFEFANDAIIVHTDREQILDVNLRAVEMFGYTRDELIKTKASRLLSQNEPLRWIFTNPYDFLNKTVRVRFQQKNRREISTEINITPLVTVEQTLFMALIRDITDRLDAEEKIRRLAYYDPLTGLANRFNFFQKLEAAITSARRNQQAFALLYIDLDMFKPINDTLGHKAGDTVLAEVATRFRANIEDDDVAARLGGDEFILLLHLKDDRIRHYAESTVVNIMAALEAPIPYREHDCYVGASIGISAYPFDGEDADTLLRKADAAMYTAKERGRGFYCFYSSVESEQES